VNRSIRRLYLTLAGGFGLLVLMLGWWQVVAANGLKNHANNLQTIQVEKLIDRGRILTADGTILAYSRARRVQGQREFERVYPQGDLAAQVVGYISVDKGKAGVESSYNKYLAGSFGSQPLLQRLGAREKQGANVQLSIDSRVQRVAQEQLAGKKGAVVALNPRTGQILAMASSPTFDNQTVLTDYSSILTQPDAPLLNRSTLGLYPPGSTFKVVTATSALESGRFGPTSLFPGGSTYKTPGGEIHNFGNATYPPHTLTTALTNSINATFAQIGDELGAQQLGATMTAYGFAERPPLDLPEVAISGRRKGTKVLPNDQSDEDTARIAIGQEQLTVTPLQMAMVAGTVANGGTLMAPRLMSRVVDRGGSVVKRADVQKMDQVMSAQNAAQLTTMMEDVVREGTGTAAALSSTGTTVAGKTGTAETADPNKNQAWFIGFAPAGNPSVAIAVVIEDTSGTGGVVAAPVAAQVMRSAIAPGGNG
jgi:penicillin-binding protein A